MTRSTIKWLTKPLEEPEREFRRLRRAAWRQLQTESLVIAGRNLFDDEESSSNNTRTKPPTPLKSLREHSHPNSSGFQNPINLPTEQTGRIVDSCGILLIQRTCTFQGLRNEDPLRHVKHYLSIVDIIQADGATRDISRLRFFHISLKGKVAVCSFTEEEGWNRIEEYVQYQDDMWDDLSPSMDVSSISKAMQPTIRGRLKRACNQITYLKTPTQEVRLKNPHLICDYYGGSHKADECEKNNPAEQVCLSGGYIYDDPSLLRFYQNDDTPPWDNRKRKEKREDGPEWIVKSKFEDELANFMLENKSHTKGIREMFDQHRKEFHEQFSQILSTIRKNETPEPEAPTFSITTRSGVSTQDPPFPDLPQSTSTNHTEGATEKEGSEGAEPSIIQ
ncbi:hypothetical protein Tco_0818548 [Tanacetum coccineum]